MQRETVQIEGNRNLYNYTFTAATARDRLSAMIETGEVGVIGPFLDLHPELDLQAALTLASTLGNEEAASEIQSRIG